MNHDAQTDGKNNGVVGEGGVGEDPSSSSFSQAAAAPFSSNIIDDDAATDPPPTPSILSKNQRKKQARYEKSIAIKRRKKEQTKEVKRLKAMKEGRDLVAERACQLNNEAAGIGKAKRDAKWQSLFTRHGSRNGSFRICFDCSFESQMTEKECNSLALQIRYVYAVNRRSSHPVRVDVCGLGREKSNNKTRAQLENVDGFPDRWKDRAFLCHEDDIEMVYSNFYRCDDAKTSEEEKGGVTRDSNDDSQNVFDDTIGKNGDDGREKSLKISANGYAIADNIQHHDDTIKSSGKSLSQLPPNHKFVYLTGDSSNTLTTLNDNTTYIIGGIVDRNRLKLAALHRAEHINAHLPHLNVTTARLPLEEYLDFKGSTRILTCNHVFEILLHYRENGCTDWRTAIMAVLPCRKDVKEKKTQTYAQWSSKDDDEDGEEEEDEREDKRPKAAGSVE